MKVKHPIVADSVSAFVKGILVIENYQTSTADRPFTLPLFANGTPTLLFQTTKAQFKNQSNYLSLFGQTVLPDQLVINGEFTLIAYFLAPHSLPCLFGIQANELTDKPVDLNLISGRTALQEQLLNAKTLKQSLTLIDKYIASLIMKTIAEVDRANYVSAIMQNPFGKVLSQVQRELCVTERTFQRWFETNIGISPSQFRRIAQFNQAFQQLNNRKFTNLSELAFANGYSDQSHYIRAFKEFTRLTPKEYLQTGNLR